MKNQTGKLIKGGSFLIEDITYDQMFTMEDLSEEQKMIEKTTEDFTENEVVPQIEFLEKHEFNRSVALLKAQGN